jgi:pyruvate,water dikinase
MVPFGRTPAEADRVLAVMTGAGLVRGEHDLRTYAMCEIPSNVFLAEAFGERDPAVIALIRDVITRAHAVGVPVGLCVQAPGEADWHTDVECSPRAVRRVGRPAARVSRREARRIAE